MVLDLFRKANEQGVTLHLPVDFVTASKFAEDAEASYLFRSSATTLSI